MAKTAQKSVVKSQKQVANKKSAKQNKKAKQVKKQEVESPKTMMRPRLIVAQRKFNRWYVYFQGVAPKENVGCGCKTAKSAIRYMHLLKFRYGAIISSNIYERIAFEASKEA